MAKPIPALVAAAIVIGAGVWGGRKYLYARDHVVTENAQVDGPLIPIAPKLQAYVTDVRVVENQKVHTGDTLLVLDAREVNAHVMQLEADLAAAAAMAGSSGHGGQLPAELAAAQATASATESAVQSAEVSLRKATADLERMRGLAAKQIVPAQQLDAAQAAADAARASLESARRQQSASQAQVGAASAALSGADAKVAAARATLDAALLQRKWSVITAPATGTVSRRNADRGALVQPGQIVMMLVPDSAVWITANVKETRLQNVTIGDSVTFTVDSYGDHEFRGAVESLSPATGARFALLPPDNATGNFTKVVQNVPVHIAIAEPIDPAFPLRRGMSVEVTISTRH